MAVRLKVLDELPQSFARSVVTDVFGLQALEALDLVRNERALFRVGLVQREVAHIFFMFS